MNHVSHADLSDTSVLLIFANDRTTQATSSSGAGSSVPATSWYHVPGVSVPVVWARAEEMIFVTDALRRPWYYWWEESGDSEQDQDSGQT